MDLKTMRINFGQLKNNIEVNDCWSTINVNEQNIYICIEPYDNLRGLFCHFGVEIALRPRAFFPLDYNSGSVKWSSHNHGSEKDFRQRGYRETSTPGVRCQSHSEGLHEDTSTPEKLYEICSVVFSMQIAGMPFTIYFSLVK